MKGMTCMSNNSQSCAVYGLGLIGAVVYFWLRSAPTFGDKLFALLKALVWPAMVVYHLLRHLAV